MATTLEALRIDPDHLIGSLVKLAPSLPIGLSYWVSDNRSLTPMDKPSGEDFPPQSIGVLNNSELVTISNPWEIKRLTTETTYVEIPHETTSGRAKVFFSNGYLYNPSVKVAFYPADRNYLSRGLVIMPLAPSCDSLSLDYVGDDTMLIFRSLGMWSKEQIALVFKDGQVPNIDIQDHVYRSLFEGGDRHNLIAQPQLTFDRRRDYYHSNHSRTYLIHDEGKLPPIRKGGTISGIAITEKPELPYRVDVRIKDIEEKPHRYANGFGKATKVSASIKIDDGVGRPVNRQKTFLVHASLAWLKENPQNIPGTAFAKLHRV